MTAGGGGAPGRFETRVVRLVDLGGRYFLLGLERPRGMPAPAAGQFVHVRVPEPAAGRFFLRRPISVFDCTDGRLDLLVAEVGAGTRRLRALRVGDAVDLVGPLGEAFPDRGGRRVLAVAGGVGLAPLLYYGRRRPGGVGRGVRLVYGARSAGELLAGPLGLDGPGVVLATEDGSAGARGDAVTVARREFDREPADVLFSCGPTPMMRAVEAFAREAGVPHFASLENRMACGVGACRTCVVPLRDAGDAPYRTVCRDGPVFDGATLDWDGLPSP